MRMKFLHAEYKMDFRKWSLSLTLLSLFLTAIPIQATNYVPAEKISIEEAFTLIGIEYGVHFNYDRAVVVDVEVDYESGQYEKVEDALQFVFSQTHLKYEIFDQRYVAVYRQDREGVESMKKMVSHFQEVISNSEEAYHRTERRVTPPLASLSIKDIYSKRIVFSVSGTVTDQDGESLIGVNIQVKGSNKGTSTDFDGNFTLEDIDENVVLVVSYVGYQTQEVSVDDKTILTIVMQEEVQTLDELVVVGYGAQRKETLTGSIASIKGSELSLAPVTNISTTLGGRLPGLISMQTSGLPGSDSPSLSIRGFGGALVIVDGVEADLSALDPNSIESVSILKDGSASIYGARAGNGVMLITTKRGKIGKPLINVESSFGLQGITIMPRPINAGQYAEMSSEIWLNAGNPPSNVPFTKDQIEKFYEGTDPLYPNTNWYDEVVRDWAPQQKHNISLTGGSERVKYYVSFGYVNQQSMWKNNGGYFERFNLQSNLDAEITDDLSLQVNLSSIMEERNFTERTQTEGGQIWSDFWNTLPIYPSELPDPSKIPYAGDVAGIHVMSNRDIGGYDKRNTLMLRGSTALNYNFRFVKGLSAKAFLDVSPSYYDSKRFDRPVDYYTYDPQSDIYTFAASRGTTASLDQYTSKNRNLTSQLSLKYDQNINQKHEISALVLFESLDYRNDHFSARRGDFLTPTIDQMFAGSTGSMKSDGGASEMARQSFVGRLNYSYKNKYLLESSFRADASAKFPPEERWGFFPSVSLGWVVSEENFMESLNNVDHLKFRASYGKSGNDGVGNFQYLSGYELGHPSILGNGIQMALVSTGLANPFLTWEKINISNVGLDFSAWQRKLYSEIDVFYRERTGIPASRITSLPSTFGAALPPENLNSLNNRGFEVKIGTAGQSKDILWDFSGNISWTRAKWGHYEEPEYIDPDQLRIDGRSGQWVDRSFGYLSDGLFTSIEEIESLDYDQDRQGNATLKPGFIRYKDINGDGVIDWRDQVEIGKSTMPNWMFGLTGNIEYKNFDFNFLFQGALGHYKNISLEQGPLYPQIVYNERWSETNNKSNALFARLGRASSNSYPTDFYYKKADYIRLKSISLGYSLPRRWLEKSKIEKTRVYISGNNLFTISNLLKYDLDPESPSGNGGRYYPQQRIINVGINLSF